MSLASVPGLAYLMLAIPTAACFAFASVVLFMTTAAAAAADVARGRRSSSGCWK